MKARHIIATLTALAISLLCLTLSAVGAFKEVPPRQTEKEGSAGADNKNEILAARERTEKEFTKKYNAVCGEDVKIYDYKAGDKITLYAKSYMESNMYEMDISFNSFTYAKELPEHLKNEDVSTLEAGEAYLIAEVSITSHSDKDEIYMMNNVSVEGLRRKELQYSSGREFIGSARCHYELHPEEELTCELVFIAREDSDLTLVVDNCGTAKYCGHTAILEIKTHF